MIQVINHTKKTFTYQNSAPNLITGDMTLSKKGYHAPEKVLTERGYTMLRQMGVDNPYLQR